MPGEPSYAGVVFDLDDTLFDHHGAASAGVSAWLASRGVAATPDVLACWFEAESRGTALWLSGEMSLNEQRRLRVQTVLAHAGCETDDLDELDRGFATYLQGYRSGWRRFDDVLPAFDLLDAAGIPVAILTNGVEEVQRQKVARVGLSDRVVALLTAEALGVGKPHKDAYARACESLGLPPERVLHVGDRHDLDVLAAREAGLGAVHLDRRRSGPDHEPRQIRTLDELAPFLFRREVGSS